MKLKMGFVIENKVGEYVTLNRKLKIALKKKKGHIHVTVTGSKRLAILTSIKDGLSRLEFIALASFVYRQIDHYPNLSDARKALDTNYADVFGSLWTGGNHL